MLPEIGIPGLILILVVALLVFGPKRLPEMGRSLGRGMREFKDSISGKDDDARPEQLTAAAEDTHEDEPVSAAPSKHDR
jgi:sec-independent protein translocase protein TatA